MLPGTTRQQYEQVNKKLFGLPVREGFQNVGSVRTEAS
jgi:hypothetical protein